jgi:hypothetical protein
MNIVGKEIKEFRLVVGKEEAGRGSVLEDSNHLIPGRRKVSTKTYIAAGQSPIFEDTVLAAHRIHCAVERLADVSRGWVIQGARALRSFMARLTALPAPGAQRARWGLGLLEIR